ncbi:MAG: RNA 2',3'-cyclic phosphodiesterase [Verrucomicrobiota bacterium]|jgi:2'-5' RNA ligase|nr:RNA 2',3'-cyclic phosphodiesterase [Verrucomicrobiota bacterium]
MRVFLAIVIPDEVKAALDAAVQRLSPAASDVAWCGRGPYHLTLVFLGEIAPSILPHVTAAIDRVCAATPPFECRAYGFGFFGTKRNPKTLWAGIDPVPELESLYERLWTELQKYGMKKDDVHFRPHVTLGRCRESTNNRAVIEAMDADEDIAFGAWQVSRVTVYESRPTPRGAQYRALSRSALQGA